MFGSTPSTCGGKDITSFPNQVYEPNAPTLEGEYSLWYTICGRKGTDEEKWEQVAAVGAYGVFGVLGYAFAFVL